MKSIRYYKSDEQLARAFDEPNGEIEAVVIDYLTDPELAALAVPSDLRWKREPHG